jgi:hypothetical protein
LPARAPSWTAYAAGCRTARSLRPPSSSRSPNWVGTDGATPGSCSPTASPSTDERPCCAARSNPSSSNRSRSPARRRPSLLQPGLPRRPARRAPPSAASLARLERAAHRRASALRCLPASPDRSDLRHQHLQRRGGCRPGGPLGHWPAPPVGGPARSARLPRLLRRLANEAGGHGGS